MSYTSDSPLVIDGVAIGHRAESSGRHHRLLHLFARLRPSTRESITSLDDYEGTLEVLWMMRPTNRQLVETVTTWKKLGEYHSEHSLGGRLMVRCEAEC